MSSRFMYFVYLHVRNLSNLMTYNDLRSSAKVQAMRTPVGDRIRKLRKERDFTQEQLAAKAGLGRTHLTAIETGAIQMPDTPTLNAIARALDASVVDLLGGTPIRVIAPANHASDDAAPLRLVPIEYDSVDFRRGFVEVPVDAEVACGLPMDYSVKGETVLMPEHLAPDPSKGEYAIRARGDSMVEFGIEDGDYVIVEARPGGVAASGELVIAWYDPTDSPHGGGITLKRWIRKSGRKILQAGNPESPSYELRDGDVFELKGIVRRSYRLKTKDFPRISG